MLVRASFSSAMTIHFCKSYFTCIFAALFVTNTQTHGVAVLAKATSMNNIAL